MKKILISLVFIFSKSFLFAQAVELTRHIEVNARLMSTDHLGNIYVVRDNNLLVRYNSKGDSIGMFNDIKKGKISHIDATNPLRILLYFKDYNQIVILDNMLSAKTIIKLNGLNLFNVTAIANSADNMIWLFDASQSSLLKIDDKPTIKFTTPLRNILDEPPLVHFMEEYDRMLYTVDSTKGIDKYDLYGFYNTTYHFKTKEIQRFNEQFVFYVSPNIISYNTLNLQEKQIAIPEPETVLQVRTERDRLFVLRKQALDIYTLQQ